MLANVHTDPHRRSHAPTHTKQIHRHLLIILLAAHKLWSHPVRSTNHRLPLLLFLCELHTKPEIRHLHLSPAINQDIVGLDIPVYAPHLVQECQGQKRCSSEVAHLCFCQLQPLCLAHLRVRHKFVIVVHRGPPFQSGAHCLCCMRLRLIQGWHAGKVNADES